VNQVAIGLNQVNFNDRPGTVDRPALSLVNTLSVVTLFGRRGRLARSLSEDGHLAAD